MILELSDPTVDEAIEAIGPLDGWAHNCHAASIALVEALAERGTFARVARGACRGVGGQHSWVVLGRDCYDESAPLVDPTLWSYDDTVEGIWFGTMADGRHRPKGYGPHIMQWGCPVGAGEAEIELTPSEPLGVMARTMIDLFRGHGTLDRTFWMQLVNHAPMVGWPAGEIIAAMLDTPELAVLVPVDLAGMLTDRNPDGLYLAGPERESVG